MCGEKRKNQFCTKLGVLRGPLRLQGIGREREAFRSSAWRVPGHWLMTHKYLAAPCTFHLVPQSVYLKGFQGEQSSIGYCSLICQLLGLHTRGEEWENQFEHWVITQSSSSFGPETDTANGSGAGAGAETWTGTGTEAGSAIGVALVLGLSNEPFVVRPLGHS